MTNDKLADMVDELNEECGWPFMREVSKRLRADAKEIIDLRLRAMYDDERKAVAELIEEHVDCNPDLWAIMKKQRDEAIEERDRALAKVAGQ